MAPDPYCATGSQAGRQMRTSGPRRSVPAPRTAKHPISDQKGVFVCDVFAQLLRDRNVKHRLGAVGKHASIAVTERLIWTLKREWLARVRLIRGLDHLAQLLGDFEVYYNECRSHQGL